MPRRMGLASGTPSNRPASVELGVFPKKHPSLHEEGGAWPFMKGPPTDEPSLEDILARDFAELKIGEKNLNPKPAEKTPKKESINETKPRVYNQRIDAVEERDAFVVKAPKKSQDEPAKRPSKTILAKPSAEAGDDFDVDW